MMVVQVLGVALSFVQCVEVCGVPWGAPTISREKRLQNVDPPPGDCSQLSTYVHIHTIKNKAHVVFLVKERGDRKNRKSCKIA
jgi:hypothetical protein